MNKKYYVMLWLLVLLLGAAIFPGLVLWSRMDEAFSIAGILSYSLIFYDLFLYHEGGPLSSILPVSVFVCFMALLSIVAWIRKPGTHTLIGTVLGVWGMCGVPGWFAIFLAAFFFIPVPTPAPSEVTWALYTSLMLIYSIPSLYILYHFRKSFKRG